MTPGERDLGVEGPGAPVAPEAPEAPDAPAPPFDETPANDGRTPSRFPDAIPTQSPQELLRRAALGPVDASEQDDVEVENPDSWADPASLRELRMLTRFGPVAALFIVPAAIYWFRDGPASHSAYFTLMLALGGMGLVLMFCMFLVGVMATLRRGRPVLLVLGIVLTPFVYSIWAAVLLSRLGDTSALPGEDA